MIKTRGGQTALEISQEFMQALRQMPSGGADGEALTKIMVDQEFNPAVQLRLTSAITAVSGTQVNALESPMIVRNNVNCSRGLLGYICTQSRTNPEMINDLIGMFCCEFYHNHNRDEQVTLRWLMDEIGHGKVIGPVHFFRWARASIASNGKSIFEQLHDDDVYTYVLQVKAIVH